MNNCPKDSIDTAIITWISYRNFGTFLQAYALQNVLESLGYRNKIIGDKRIAYPNWVGLMGKLKQQYVNIFYPSKNSFNNLLRARNFDSFVKSKLNIDTDWSELNELSSRYSTFICGSDQIWSPLLPNDHDGFYFASFAGTNKLIAYAPSLGTKSNVPLEYIVKVRPWLNKFTSLSAREMQGAKILSKITGRSDIETVLDPTLLLPRDHWIDLESKNTWKRLKRSEPYVLGYFLTYNETYISRARELAKARGLKLICLNSFKLPSNLTDRTIIGAGPMEFLSLIANSALVVTDSFHGTIFSLHFRKPFITVKRFAAEDANCQNSRLENLFNIIGVTDNFLDESSLNREVPVPDWDKVEGALGKERKHSLDFLKKALKNEG